MKRIIIEQLLVNPNTHALTNPQQWDFSFFFSQLLNCQSAMGDLDQSSKY